MNRIVFARHALVRPPWEGRGPAVLLEGSWPPDAPSGEHRSLDAAVDARFARIDREAHRLTERLGSTPAALQQPGCSPLDAAWLTALGLRYYLVKLLRVVLYFTEIRPLAPGETVTLVCRRGQDEDYAALFAQLAGHVGAILRVHWDDRSKPGTPLFPPNGPLRRMAGRVARTLDGRRPLPEGRPRVVLCGNPRLLAPVCRELVRRDAAVWWLFDRFAFRPWLRWRRAGCRQLVCDSDRGRRSRLVVPESELLTAGGVDLGLPVRQWIAGRVATDGPRLTRLATVLDEHFARVRPTALVLDEDATPLARAAVAVARRRGVRSLVVQHGAPCCRFGFAPLAADRILVWGRSSREQLVAWGVPEARIGIVGSAGQRAQKRRPARRFRRPAAGPRVLLLATVPPRDERPDAVELHLTRASYAEMIRAAVSAVSRIADVKLTVKLHPRAGDDPVVRAVLAGFPRVSAQTVRRGRLDRLVRSSDCVLSCMSSAGVEAAMAGVPTIGLLPVGSGDVLPPKSWGLVGTARSETELGPLLTRCLSPSPPAPLAPRVAVFAHTGREAASRIADEVLSDSTSKPPAAGGSPWLTRHNTGAKQPQAAACG